MALRLNLNKLKAPDVVTANSSAFTRIQAVAEELVTDNIDRSITPNTGVMSIRINKTGAALDSPRINKAFTALHEKGIAL